MELLYILHLQTRFTKPILVSKHFKSADITTSTKSYTVHQMVCTRSKLEYKRKQPSFRFT